jgi:integrase
LASLDDAEEARNVILTDDQVRQLIAQAYDHSGELGILVETAAATGARVSQLARLEVQDLQDGPAPRLPIPASRKGRGQKAVLRRPVPISPALARKLAANVSGKLLRKPSGAPWAHADHCKLFKRVAGRCGLEATMYALRHSSIVRQLLAGVPVRVVAANHDTSVVMIERNYSRHIGDHADALVRAVLLDTGVEAGADR